MTELVEAETEEDPDVIRERLKVIRRGETQDGLIGRLAEDHEEWLADVGFSFSNLSRQAQKERKEAVAELERDVDNYR